MALSYESEIRKNVNMGVFVLSNDNGNSIRPTDTIDPTITYCINTVEWYGSGGAGND